MIGYVLDESVSFRATPVTGVSLNGAGNASCQLISKKPPTTNGATGSAGGNDRLRVRRVCYIQRGPLYGGSFEWSGKCVVPAELKKTAHHKRRDGIGRGEMTGYVLDESVTFRGPPFTGVPLNGAGNVARPVSLK